MLSIWKHIYWLEYWIQIGIGDDVVTCKDARLEYKPIVEKLLKTNIPPEKIPGKVLNILKAQAEIPFYKRPYFYYLLKLQILMLFKR